MACTSPIRAYRDRGGRIKFGAPPDESCSEREFLRLSCGGCLSCRSRRARDWAIRCQLELKSHDAAAWCTLTYEDRYLPPTLVKAHVSRWLRSVRRTAPNRVRFFACGEYGERTLRPHYHCIVYGENSAPRLEGAWPYGFVRVDPVTPAVIAYTAGYAAKKLRLRERGEREWLVSPDGELYQHQPPFLLMSRRPGIGAEARDKYWQSWRKSARSGNAWVPVPRYLHEGWRRRSSDEEIAARDAELREFVQELDLRARAINALAKHQRQSEKRSL